MKGAKPSVAETFKQGIVACREERWRDGYGLLARVASAVEGKKPLPSIFYSYLGLSMAHCEGRKREGLQLCRYAVRLQPRQAENQLNLALAYRMVQRRRAAVKALRKGLRLSPHHARLLKLEQELGIRRRPIVPFLSRQHLLNRNLGRARSRYLEWRRERQEERLEEEAFAQLD